MSELQDRIQNITPKHAVVVGLLLAGLYYYLYIDGGAKAMRDIAKQKVALTKVQNDLHDIETLVGDFDKYQKEITEKSVIFEEALKFLPARENIYVIVKQLHLEARKSGVNITMVKPLDENIQQEFYEELPFSLEARGGYIPIVTFLSRIASLSRIINLKNIELTGDGKNAITPMVKLTAIMHAYRFKEKVDPAAAAAAAAGKAGVKK